MRYPDRFVSDEPSVLRVGGVHDSVAAPFELDTAFTAIANAASETVDVPSLTLIVTFEYVPTFELLGVPDSRPVVVLKLAHDGLLAMLNVSVLPFGSLAVGVKAYAFPAVTERAGEPLIVGGEFVEVAARTEIANAGSEAVVLPSLTVILMLE
jgi:hypothetical protein